MQNTVIIKLQSGKKLIEIQLKSKVQIRQSIQLIGDVQRSQIVPTVTVSGRDSISHKTFSSCNIDSNLQLLPSNAKNNSKKSSTAQH